MTIEDKAAEEFAKEMVGENYMDREDWQDSAFRYMFAFKAGIEWKEEQMIEKAVEWLNDNWRTFVEHNKEDGVVYFWNLEEDFKQAMKGE